MGAPPKLARPRYFITGDVEQAISTPVLSQRMLAATLQWFYARIAKQEAFSNNLSLKYEFFSTSALHYKRFHDYLT
jgi:hypothetical protein